MAEPVDTTANANQGDGTSNLWGDFVGTGQSRSEPAPNPGQTVNIAGHTVNVPPQSSARGRGGKGSHNTGTSSKGTWVPVLQEQQNPVPPENRGLHSTDGSRAPSMFASSGPYNQKGEGKNRGKEGKNRSKGKEGKASTKGLGLFRKRDRVLQ